MTFSKRLAAASAVVIAAGTASALAATKSMLPLGPGANSERTTFQAFYDGHKDAYFVTDVSSKAQATAMHINFSKELAGVKGAPAQYFVLGRAAAGQLSVFGSEPGEDDYSPLWQEITVTWKPGVTPVLLTKDDQVKDLASKGMLTLSPTPIVLNCPIVKVG